VVVANFDLFGSSLGPLKADTTLIIDADRMLSFSFSRKRFQPVPWWNSKITEILSSMQLQELAKRDPRNISEAFGSLAKPKLLGVLVGERKGHRFRYFLTMN
jgi:hypothetical protein